MIKQVILSTLMASLVTAPVSAVSDLYKSMNDIEFYDPEFVSCIESATEVGVPPGNDNLPMIYNYFLAKGVSTKAAAAITGSIYQESKGDPLLIQGGKRTSDPSKVGLYSDGSMFENKPGQTSVGKAWGLVQWDPGNAALYWQKRAGVSGDISKIEVQLEVIWWHLNNSAPTSRSNILAKVEAADSLKSAVSIMSSNFFGCSKCMDEKREAAAVKALSYPVDPSIVSNVISSPSSNNLCSESNYSGTIESGGLNIDQAKKLTMNYGANKNNSTKSILSSGNYWTGQSGGYNYGSNCVSFVVFFLRKFTSTNYAGGDGGKSVAKLGKAGVPTGSEPRVGAIFSWSNSSYGHTGVVLGIDGDNIIVGHASYSRKSARGAGDGTISGGGIAFIKSGNKNDPNVWYGKKPTEFAYPENIDLSSIEKYLSSGI